MKSKIQILLASIVLLVSGCFAPVAHGQDTDVIRINTELVVVDVQVTNKKTGQPVGDLTRDDFAIYEDGGKQDIEFFDKDKLPLSVVLLFDLTESVQPVLLPLGQGALGALAHLKPEDEVAVMTYSASAQLIQDFTTDHNKIADAIIQASNMTSGEAAFFNEGVFRAARQTRRAANPSSRLVIIWLTDNVPNVPSEGTRRSIGASLGSEMLHTEKDAFRELFESGAVVTSLLEKSALSKIATVLFTKNPIFAPSRHAHPPGDVNKYASQTGGEVMGASKEEVSTKLALMLDHLRNRYSIGYHPAADKPKGTFCKLKLTLTPAAEKRLGKVVVRSRAGYIRGVQKRVATPTPPN